MIKQLIEKGSVLADKLEKKASEYHVKSDANEKISWEAVGVRTRVNDLINGNINARKDTAFKGIEWGKELVKFSPDLSEEVCSFYKEYYEY